MSIWRYAVPMSKKFWPYLYSNLLYILGHYFLDIQYHDQNGICYSSVHSIVIFVQSGHRDLCVRMQASPNIYPRVGPAQPSINSWQPGKQPMAAALPPSLHVENHQTRHLTPIAWNTAFIIECTFVISFRNFHIWGEIINYKVNFWKLKLNKGIIFQ